MREGDGVVEEDPERWKNETRKQLIDRQASNISDAPSNKGVWSILIMSISKCRKDSLRCAPATADSSLV